MQHNSLSLSLKTAFCMQAPTCQPEEESVDGIFNGMREVLRESLMQAAEVKEEQFEEIRVLGISAHVSIMEMWALAKLEMRDEALLRVLTATYSWTRCSDQTTPNSWVLNMSPRVHARSTFPAFNWLSLASANRLQQAKAI
jgi:hypothetical protein